MVVYSQNVSATDIRKKTEKAESLLKNKLTQEIKRAERFDFKIALVFLGLTKTSPPKLLLSLSSIKAEPFLKNAIRPYDFIIALPQNKFGMMFPFQSQEPIENAINQRITKLSQDNNWGKFAMTMAIYPDEAKDAENLLCICKKRLESMKLE
jgi:hypothetical protein